MGTVHARQALPTEPPHYPQSPWLKNQITGLLPRVRLLGKDEDYRKRNPAGVGDEGGGALGLLEQVSQWDGGTLCLSFLLSRHDKNYLLAHAPLTMGLWHLTRNPKQGSSPNLGLKISKTQPEES